MGISWEGWTAFSAGLVVFLTALITAYRRRHEDAHEVRLPAAGAAKKRVPV